MSSETSRTPASSSSGAPASSAPASNPNTQRAAEIRAAMARARAAAAAPRRLQAGRDYNPLQGGQRGFLELYSNLARDPSKATLLNTASDLKEVGLPSLRGWGEHIERRLAIGADIGGLVRDTKAFIGQYLSPAERRQLADQGIVVGGRKKTRKGKSRRRYTRRR